MNAAVRAEVAAAPVLGVFYENPIAVDAIGTDCPTASFCRADAGDVGGCRHGVGVKNGGATPAA